MGGLDGCRGGGGRLSLVVLVSENLIWSVKTNSLVTSQKYFVLRVREYFWYIYCSECLRWFASQAFIIFYVSECIMICFSHISRHVNIFPVRSSWWILRSRAWTTATWTTLEPWATQRWIGTLRGPEFGSGRTRHAHSSAIVSNTGNRLLKKTLHIHCLEFPTSQRGFGYYCSVILKSKILYIGWLM